MIHFVHQMHTKKKSLPLKLRGVAMRPSGGLNSLFFPTGKTGVVMEKWKKSDSSNDSDASTDGKIRSADCSNAAPESISVAVTRRLDNIQRSLQSGT